MTMGEPVDTTSVQAFKPFRYVPYRNVPLVVTDPDYNSLMDEKVDFTPATVTLALLTEELPGRHCSLLLVAHANDLQELASENRSVVFHVDPKARQRFHDVAFNTVHEWIMSTARAHALSSVGGAGFERPKESDIDERLKRWKHVVHLDCGNLRDTAPITGLRMAEVYKTFLANMEAVVAQPSSYEFKSMGRKEQKLFCQQIALYIEGIALGQKFEGALLQQGTEASVEGGEDPGGNSGHADEGHVGGSSVTAPTAGDVTLHKEGVERGNPKGGKGKPREVAEGSKGKPKEASEGSRGKLNKEVELAEEKEKGTKYVGHANQVLDKAADTLARSRAMQDTLAKGVEQLVGDDAKAAAKTQETVKSVETSLAGVGDQLKTAAEGAVAGVGPHVDEAVKAAVTTAVSDAAKTMQEVLVEAVKGVVNKKLQEIKASIVAQVDKRVREAVADSTNGLKTEIVSMVRETTRQAFGEAGFAALPSVFGAATALARQGGGGGAGAKHPRGDDGSDTRGRMAADTVHSEATRLKRSKAGGLEKGVGDVPSKQGAWYATTKRRWHCVGPSVEGSRWPWRCGTDWCGRRCSKGGAADSGGAGGGAQGDVHNFLAGMRAAMETDRQQHPMDDQGLAAIRVGLHELQPVGNHHAHAHPQRPVAYTPAADDDAHASGAIPAEGRLSFPPDLFDIHLGEANTYAQEFQAGHGDADAEVEEYVDNEDNEDTEGLQVHGDVEGEETDGTAGGALAEVEGGRGRKGPGVRKDRNSPGWTGDIVGGGRSRYLGYSLERADVEFTVSVAMIVWDGYVSKVLWDAYKEGDTPPSWPEQWALAKGLPKGLWTCMWSRAICGDKDRLTKFFTHVKAYQSGGLDFQPAVCLAVGAIAANAEARDTKAAIAYGVTIASTVAAAWYLVSHKAPQFAQACQWAVDVGKKLDRANAFPNLLDQLLKVMEAVVLAVKLAGEVEGALANGTTFVNQVTTQALTTVNMSEDPWGKFIAGELLHTLAYWADSPDGRASMQAVGMVVPLSEAMTKLTVYRMKRTYRFNKWELPGSAPARARARGGRVGQQQQGGGRVGQQHGSCTTR
ncbi:unnamed protein product [Closterium sp. Yama58-4]|nr:unnamed protein product [Closterium sp. Yama58-4]